jgi:hypothetical protein
MQTLETERPVVGFGNSDNGRFAEADLLVVESDHPEQRRVVQGAIQFIWDKLRLYPVEASPAMSQHFGHAERRNDPAPQFDDPNTGHLG